MEDVKIPRKLEKPSIDAEAWVAPGAVLVGRMTICRGASIWYNCVLRSDLGGAEIVVGEDSNIQDGAVLHVDEELPCRIGARVTVGHGAVLHATTVEDDCLIGMGAVVLSRSTIGRGSVIAAGALVPEGMEVPRASSRPASRPRSDAKSPTRIASRWSGAGESIPGSATCTGKFGNEYCVPHL